MLETKAQATTQQDNLTPMLEALLQADTAPPNYALPDVPQTIEEAEQQLDELMARRAAAMKVLASLES